MKLIDRFLIGRKAAMFDAALPADVSWLEQLLARYKSGVSKPLVAAPARGHKDVVVRLLASTSELSRKRKEASTKSLQSQLSLQDIAL
ncbi:hypothetical protein F442_08893 [Phytophthora nicotianae P10297]|uniref:Uncharacterized protein n=1 Tax=Phytophthora nicotianae P10297 TaxID=1317064 RepID=W2ZBZ3_PHYNI|nr:hypothetical protein F442_08893 [Phytophthora nicotianae P10297]